MLYFDFRNESALAYNSSLREKMSANSVMIFNNIYRSKAIGKAWAEIKYEERNNLILDFHKYGVVIKVRDIPSGYFPLHFLTVFFHLLDDYIFIFY